MPARSDPAVDREIEGLVAAVLRGDHLVPAALVAYGPDMLCACADGHGVLPLVADRLARREDLPSRLRSLCRDGAGRSAATDLWREVELKRMLTAFGRADIPALVIKGAHLAYDHYPRPDLRPRKDTDILIPSAARGAVDRSLKSLGYGLAGHVSGDLVMYQAPYVKHYAGAVRHMVDVHWKIANAHAFADVLAYEELAAAAVPLPRLSPFAHGLDDVHALALACLHRVAHHFDSTRMIWMYDIHLLASRLDPAAWDRFTDLVVRRGVSTVCRRSLARTMATFRTDVPADAMTRLRPETRAAAEASAAYLQPHRRHVQLVVSDLRALTTWASRWQLVREHAFPPARYMREAYAPASGAPLPFLYVRRAIRGARKWLARS